MRFAEPIRRLLFASAVCAGAPTGGSAAAETGFALRFLESRKIADRDHGFTEPSGLALASGGGFWSVSDDTGALFRLNAEGEVEASIALDADDLEGVAAAGDRLYAIEEETRTVIAIDARSGETVARRALKDMDGYDSVADALHAAPDGKGLEGIAVDPRGGAVFVANEGEPRLLVQIAPDLSAITGMLPLTAGRGFAVEGVRDRKLDISGLAHDGAGGLWILSDEGARVFHLDLASGAVNGAALAAERKGEMRRVKNPEGIACDPAARRLYIVSDDGGKSRLYVYELR